ncbi:MAG: Yip1 family protein [Gammaproteobacteria bacterium]
MVSHLIGILINPSEEWKKIRDVECTIGKCYCGYVFIMAAIAPICGYFGTTMFGWEIGAREAVKLSPDSALMIAIAYYLVTLVGVFSMGLMIHWMGKTYDAEQDLSRCVRLAAFTATPLFLVGIVQLFPILWLNFIIGLPALAYTVRLLYTGVPIMMEIEENRGFLFSSSILAVGMVALIAMLAAMAILWFNGFAPQFVD